MILKNYTAIFIGDCKNTIDCPPGFNCVGTVCKIGACESLKWWIYSKILSVPNIFSVSTTDKCTEDAECPPQYYCTPLTNTCANIYTWISWGMLFSIHFGNSHLQNEPGDAGKVGYPPIIALVTYSIKWSNSCLPVFQMDILTDTLPHRHLIAL